MHALAVHACCTVSVSTNYYSGMHTNLPGVP